MKEKLFDLTKLQNGSDIRGVAIPSEKERANLMKSEVSAITRGFIEIAKGKTLKIAKDLVISVGCDSRLSGPYLKGVILNTLSENGVTAIDCGLASTPAMFMSTKFSEYDCDLAIMITASHLPYNRNGMKFFDRDGGFQKNDITGILENASKYYAPSLSNVDEKEMLAAVNSFSEGFMSAGYENPKKYNGESYPLLMDIYAAHLRNSISEALSDAPLGATSSMKGEAPLSGLNICVDAGNGAGGFFATKVLAPLGADISESQFLEPDGYFPNHIPNPENKEAMASICGKVASSKVDLGLIFDTDVDRSAAVTPEGKEIARNGIVALAASLIAQDDPGSTVVTDSITSTGLTHFLEENLGLKHLRYMRGYKNVINKALELEKDGVSCPLAIETSGHAALRENFFLDDGAYLATKIVIATAKLKKEGKTIGNIIEGLKEPIEAREFRLKVNCDDFGGYAQKVLDELEAWAEVSSNQIVDTSLSPMKLASPNFEGVRLEFPSGWCLLRKSLHDPVMPLNIESDVVGGVDSIKNLLLGFLKDYQLVDSSELQ